MAIISSVVFYAVVSDKTDYGSVGLASNRGLSQLDEVCVFFMLFSVALLWRPRAVSSSLSADELEMMEGMADTFADVEEENPFRKAVYA